MHSVLGHHSKTTCQKSAKSMRYRVRPKSEFYRKSLLRWKSSPLSREIAIKKKNLCLFKQTPIPAKVTFYFIPRPFETCLACQHVISDWLGKLKPDKLPTGCQNALKLAAFEKGTDPGRRLLLLLRPRRSVVLLTKPPC